MKKHLTTLIVTLSALFTSAAGFAQNLILNTAAVEAAQKRGALLWDVRSPADYQRGHLPGAINIGDAGVVLRNANTEDFLPLPQVEKVLGDGGLDPAKDIVVYGARGHVMAYFGLYTLQYFGAKNVRVYHEGVDGWREAGLALSTETHKVASVALKLTAQPAIAVTTEEVIAKLKDTNVQIVDARTQGEFAGNDIRAIRGGHIPGAINIPYETNWVDPDTAAKLARKQVADTRGMSLKPADDLKKLYANLDPAKETVVYCQSGVRAAETATVLADLGFKNVRVYDSSWLGYAGRLDAPANNQVFLNIGALNSRIGAMQGRIDALEAELKARAKPQ